MRGLASTGGYLGDGGALTFHPRLFAGGRQPRGMSDLGTFYRHRNPWIADARIRSTAHPVQQIASYFERLSRCAGARRR